MSIPSDSLVYSSRSTLINESQLGIHHSNKSTPANDSLFELMQLSDDDWNNRDTSFDKRLDDFAAIFQVNYEYGLEVLEKRHLKPGSIIVTVGDIHGNQRAVKLIFNCLQEKGLLDEKYLLKEGVYIVFIGDYSDRGTDSLQVLELLMALKMENPDNIILLKGNHEDAIYSLSQIKNYAEKDPRHKKYLTTSGNVAKLDRLFRCMPVGIYLGQKGISQEINGEIKKKVNQEYMQFTHGFAHLCIDPFPLFTSEKDILIVKNQGCFSSRINHLYAPLHEKVFTQFRINVNLELYKMEDISDLSIEEQSRPSNKERMRAKNKCKPSKCEKREVVNTFKEEDQKFYYAYLRVLNADNQLNSNKTKNDLSKYYWLDVGHQKRTKSTGRWALLPNTMKAYLRLCGGEVLSPEGNLQVFKVKRAMRGHQAVGIQDSVIEEYKKGNPKVSVVVTTLDPSKEPNGTMISIHTVKPKVRDWKREIYAISWDGKIGLLPDERIPRVNHRKF